MFQAIGPIMASAMLVWRMYASRDYYQYTFNGVLTALSDYFTERAAIVAKVVFVEHADELVGTLMYSCQPGNKADTEFPEIMQNVRSAHAKVGYIGKFATNPAVKSDVVCRLLLSTGLRKLAEEGCTAIVMIVNPAHQGFYRALGAEVLGEIGETPGLEKAPGVLLVLDLRTEKTQRRITRSLQGSINVIGYSVGEA